MSDGTAIIGAGLSGLLAAHHFPSLPILERGFRPEEKHKALLRFRTDDVATLTGIPFRAVTVRKAIHDGHNFVAPTISLANQYSAKVLNGRLEARSVWDLDSVTRYVAPKDFIWRLMNNLGGRIQWGCSADFKARAEEGLQSISTAPLPSTMRALGLVFEREDWFQYEPIRVRRYTIEDVDLHQTIYLPTLHSPFYRVSITGDTLICESPGEDLIEDDTDALALVRKIFSLEGRELQSLGSVRQSYGKIVPIPEIARKAILTMLTEQFGIYSLGRFGAWRNILLDDVVGDLKVIRSLMTADPYRRKLITNTKE